MDEILVCDHSNESCCTLLLCGTICFFSFLQNDIFDFFFSFWTWALLAVKRLCSNTILTLSLPESNLESINVVSNF